MYIQDQSLTLDRGKLRVQNYKYRITGLECQMSLPRIHFPAQAAARDHVGHLEEVLVVRQLVEADGGVVSLPRRHTGLTFSGVVTMVTDANLN